MNRIGSTELKYEIYESPDPFKGVELQFKGRQAGYILFKSLNGGNQGQEYALQDRRPKTHLDPVRVGFDFGSNNICIAMRSQSSPRNSSRFRTGAGVF